MKKLLLTTFLAILSIQILSAQVPSYVPATNLISWWGFDGDADDDFGTNNFAVTGAVLTADRNNTTSSAYQFNGTDQSMRVNSPSFILSQTGDFSISFWMQRVNLGGGIPIMSGSNAGGNFVLYISTNASGQVAYATNKQGSSWIKTYSTYSPFIWEHFVCTFSNGTMVIHKDGTQVSTINNAYTGVTQANLPFYLGRGVNGGASFFEGKLDDIGVWDRVLTQAEINNLFVGCGSISTQPVDLTAAVTTEAKFGVVAGANSSIQWQEKVGTTFQDLANGGQYSGATSDTLKVASVTNANNGETFRCIVEGGTPCADTSAEAILTVCDAITQQPTNVTEMEGSTAQFTVAYSDPTATFQWETDNGLGFLAVNNTGPYSGATSATLTVTGVGLSNDGQKFRCQVGSGACAQTSAEVVLTVNPIGLEELALNKSLSIYPNPTKNKLNVEVSAAFAKSAYSIINAAGKVVVSGTLSNTETSLDLASYPTGYYILQIETAKRGFIIAH